MHVRHAGLWASRWFGRNRCPGIVDTPEHACRVFPTGVLKGCLAHAESLPPVKLPLSCYSSTAAAAAAAVLLCCAASDLLPLTYYLCLAFSAMLPMLCFLGHAASVLPAYLCPAFCISSHQPITHALWVQLTAASHLHIAEDSLPCLENWPPCSPVLSSWSATPSMTPVDMTTCCRCHYFHQCLNVLPLTSGVGAE